MWRFLVVCFAFLGVSFYVLSGGASYEPVPNSLQAQAKLPPEERLNYRAPARQASQAGAQAQTQVQTEAEAQVDRSFDALGTGEQDADDLALTLAAVRTDAASLLAAEADRPKAELLNMALPETTFEIATNTQEEQAAIDAAVAAALGETTFDPSQIRWVKEDIIDLRAGPGLTFKRVTQLSRGEEVAVLEEPGNGWLNVQVVNGFETGWVAEWLLRKPQ